MQRDASALRCCGCSPRRPLPPPIMQAHPRQTEQRGGRRCWGKTAGRRFWVVAALLSQPSAPPGLWGRGCVPHCPPAGSSQCAELSAFTPRALQDAAPSTSRTDRPERDRWMSELLHPGSGRPCSADHMLDLSLMSTAQRCPPTRCCWRGGNPTCPQGCQLSALLSAERDVLPWHLGEKTLSLLGAV